MFRIFALILALTLSACATKGDIYHRDTSPIQNYRPKGVDTTISIYSNLDRVAVNSLNSAEQLTVYFDSKPVIQGYLKLVGNTYMGDIEGKWNDKTVSASCNSNWTSSNWLDIKCIIFIDNERTVTLSM